MTGLAGHIDFGPGRVISPTCSIVVFLQVGGVALGAHEIPILRAPGPVQFILVVDLFIGIQMKPPLPALLFRPAVPDNRKCLQSAAGKLDQILLQWRRAERVLDFEIGQFAVRSVGPNHEAPVLPEESRHYAVLTEFGILKIAEHRLFVDFLHGQIMM